MSFLDNQLCVQLYIKTRAIIRIHEKNLKPLGLTYPQALVLLTLDIKHPCFIDEVGSRLLLDIGTLSPLLKKMEAAGLIERKRDTRDERRVAISMTSLGSEKITPIKEAFDKTSAAVCLPLSEKQTLLDKIGLIKVTV